MATLCALRRVARGSSRHLSAVLHGADEVDEARFAPFFCAYDRCAAISKSFCALVEPDKASPARAGQPNQGKAGRLRTTRRYAVSLIMSSAIRLPVCCFIAIEDASSGAAQANDQRAKTQLGCQDRGCSTKNFQKNFLALSSALSLVRALVARGAFTPRSISGATLERHPISPLAGLSHAVAKRASTAMRPPRPS